MNLYLIREVSNYKSSSFNSVFTKYDIYFSIEHDIFKNISLKSDYDYQNFTDKTNNIKTHNHLFNASLFFQKENNPWSIELKANNILNNESVNNSYFNDFLISNTQKFILPRILILKISYKL